MSADWKQGTNLLGSVVANGQIATASSETTVYQPGAGTSGRIATFTLCNTSAAAVTVTVSVLQSGQTVDGTQVLISAYNMAPHESMNVVELQGGFLGPGDYVSVNVSTGAVVTYVITGAVSS